MKKSLFDEYFHFSSSERRSIFILSIFILIALSASLIIRYKPGKKEQFSEAQMQEINKLAERLSEKKQPEIIAEKPPNEPKSLFVFDPNTASKEDFTNLDFSEKQINTIKNYLNSGGKFLKKEDFKKIYTISDEQYKVYEPYISISGTEQNTKKSPANIGTQEVELISVSPPKTKIPKVELNSAEPFNLILINGIGEVFANRIIKYRELLGGFSNKEQLLEVYGINDTIFKQIMPQLVIDTSILKTIDLNTATYKEFVKHPYLDSYHANAILNYRKFKKQTISRDNLLKDNVLSKEVYNKIKPYLKP